MTENNKIICGDKKPVKKIGNSILLAFYILIILLLNSCEKTSVPEDSLLNQKDEIPAADLIAPTVISVDPANGFTSVPVNSVILITFSESMNTASINASSITLKQGTTAITGTLTQTGPTAKFAPSAILTANTLYTGTVTSAVSDSSGNTLKTDFVWTFTTAAPADVPAEVPADVTPPTVLSVSPVVNSTSAAISIKPTATFSEAMSSASITAVTFTLKQGNTSVSGTVTYTGTTATFAPAVSLSGNTVYTATITTGARDEAGNQIASNYAWSFTTAAATPDGRSFSADIVPILNLCNTCHKHGWTTAATASAFYANLVSDGYVNAASPTTSKIYKKVNAGHPSSTVTAAQKTTILTWMTEGSKNN